MLDDGSSGIDKTVRLSSLVGAVAQRLKYSLYWERSGLIFAAFRHWALSY